MPSLEPSSPSAAHPSWQMFWVSRLKLSAFGVMACANFQQNYVHEWSVQRHAPSPVKISAPMSIGLTYVARPHRLPIP